MSGTRGSSGVVVVTGGAVGIGAAIAEELGRNGAFVVTVDPGVAVDGTPQSGGEELTTAQRIVDAGGHARASNISVTDGSAVRDLFARLVEEFGLINRRDIAEDVKSLDQAGRAALRRLGVRFGAYHIFVPTLIKPAPAGLITLLWALKNDGKEKLGFGDVVHAMERGATDKGYSLVLTDTHDDPEQELRAVRELVSHRVDAVVLAPSAQPERAFALLPLLETWPDAFIPGIGAARACPAAMATDGIEALP